MENPCLTFITPTLISGDKSLVSVVIHEIMHSWTGNLVTNCTWEHFWLNEGFTVFCERKLLGRLYGKDVKNMDSEIHLYGLQEDVKRYGENSNLTKLIPSLNNISKLYFNPDPDDAFSSVPYEKGFLLLEHIQNIVGEDVMDDFLKKYLNHFKFKSITSDHFKEFAIINLDENLMKDFDWDKWFYFAGMPDMNQFDFHSVLIKQVRLISDEIASAERSFERVCELVSTLSSSQKSKS